MIVILESPLGAYTPTFTPASSLIGVKTRWLNSDNDLEIVDKLIRAGARV